MKENIEKFINKRPEVIAAYGYGSGIVKQVGYTEKDKPQIDLILVVDNLKEWHLKNIKLNKKDYSLTGRNYIKNKHIDKLKGTTGIIYVSNIIEDGNIYKYGTIEKKDLINHLINWDSFYLPGRFQKFVYPIKTDKELDKSINKNRDNALLVSAYLQDKKEVTKKDIFVTLCSLSYMGDTRMKFAENPRKVLNIVEGSFKDLDSIYSFNNSYMKEKNDKIIIDYNVLKEELNKLPSSLLKYIDEYLDKDNIEIQKKIIEYLTVLNKKESSKQTIKGLYTNGLIKSIKYASKKLTKRFKK